MSKDSKKHTRDLFAGGPRPPFADRPPAERFMLNTPGDNVRRRLLADFDVA
jgi:hypothetical protein